MQSYFLQATFYNLILHQPVSETELEGVLQQFQTEFRALTP
jgi:hypothetical protein